MNLMIVVDSFFPENPGGMARVAWDVAKAMARRGNDVSLVAATTQPCATNQTGHEMRIDGVTVHLYPRPVVQAWSPMRHVVQIAACRRALAPLLAARRWDAVHAHSIYTAQAVAGIQRRPPLIVTVHSPAIQEIIYNWRQQGLRGRLATVLGSAAIRRLEKSSLRTAAATHVLSRYTAAQLQTEYRGEFSTHHVIPHWADPAWFRTMPQAAARERLGWPQAERIVFTVRQLRHRYGIDTAIDALAPLAVAGECVFYIGGQGAELARLRAQAERSGAGDRIRFLGCLPDADLRLAYQSADVFVLPTRALECFGLIVLEAFACGVPVIATDVGAIPESVSPVAPDFLVSPEDVGALREKFTMLFAGTLVPPSPDSLVRYVQSRYQEASVLDRYQQMYGSVRARGTPGVTP